MRQNYKYIFLLLFFFVCYINIYSQNFVRYNDWKKYKKEICINFGASQFLGDLGGLNRIGTDFSPVDLEFSLTRPAASIGYRYKLEKNFNIQGSFNYLLVSGNDKLTTEPYRNNRNLNFKSNIFELALRAEVSIWRNKVGHRYGIKKTISRRHRSKSWELIGFIGVGGFYFNPKGQNPITGQWVELYPLRTEGQGLPGGPKNYRRISLSIPVGLAYRVVLGKKWSVGAEFNYRKTFTDYIDDVSTRYYPDRALQAQTYGPLSVIMSDPSKGDIPTATMPNADGTGAQRGDNEKDTYISVQITVGYYIKPKRGKSKLRSKF